MASSEHHAIPAHSVAFEEAVIRDALIRGGYDPNGLDFSQQAAQRLVEQVTDRLTQMGIAVERRLWTHRFDGGVDLVIVVPSEKDHALVRLTLG